MQAQNLNSNPYEYSQQMHGQAYKELMNFKKREALNFCLEFDIKLFELLKRTSAREANNLFLSAAAHLILDAGDYLSPTEIKKFVNSVHNICRAETKAQAWIDELGIKFLMRG